MINPGRASGNLGRSCFLGGSNIVHWQKKRAPQRAHLLFGSGAQFVLFRQLGAESNCTKQNWWVSTAPQPGPFTSARSIQIGEHVVDHGFTALEFGRIDKFVGLMGLVDRARAADDAANPGALETASFGSK